MLTIMSTRPHVDIVTFTKDEELDWTVISFQNSFKGTHTVHAAVDRME